MILDSIQPQYTLQPIQPALSIERIGYALDQRFSREFAFDGERHYFTELVYVQSGMVEASEDSEIYLLGEGELILHAPMEFHRIKSYGDTEPRIFNLSLLLAGPLPDNLYHGVFSLTFAQQSAFLQIFSLAQQLLAADSPSPLLGQEVAAALTALLLQICRDNRQSNRTLSNTGAELYKQLVRCMSESVDENCTLETLAKRNHISLTYMKELFRRYANTSPKRYYATLRIARATQLIEGGSSNADIVEQMNFSSPCYFAAFFKKHTGMTTTAYRTRRI